MNSEITYYQYTGNSMEQGYPCQIISIQDMPNEAYVKIGYYWFNIPRGTEHWSFASAHQGHLNLKGFKEITKEELMKVIFLYEL